MASEAANAKKDWGGGVSPYRVSYGKLMMWFFLVSDALTFSGLLVAYGYNRHKWPDAWPDPGQVFHHFPFVEKSLPLAYVGFMTFILIMSSVTMVLAVEAGHRNDKKKVAIWMFLTIIGGLIFVG
jgi:cytochrome c oxidase subunit III